MSQAIHQKRVQPLHRFLRNAAEDITGRPKALVMSFST